MKLGGCALVYACVNDDRMDRVGQNHIYYIYGVYMVFLAGKSLDIQSYTMSCSVLQWWQ